jgi:hypothetical protein
MDQRQFSPGATGPGAIISPDYDSPSLNKRRRLSDDERIDPREPLGQRGFHSPSRHASTSSRSHSLVVSPTSTTRRASAYSVAESWTGSSRGSPYMPSGPLPSIRSPLYEGSRMEHRGDFRPTLPSLPSLTFERRPSQIQRRVSNWAEYSLDPSRAQNHPFAAPSVYDAPPTYQSSHFPYGYSQPRGQSYSGPSGHHPERTPFSTGYTQHFHEGYMEAGENRQRKRRGNLPKETTDKLRAWFVGHLHHPYPTEDEKQELMRQTGLQMSMSILHCHLSMSQSHTNRAF